MVHGLATMAALNEDACQQTGRAGNIQRKHFVVCSHALNPDAVNIGPFDSQGAAELVAPEIEEIGMGFGRAWDDVRVLMLFTIQIDGKWHVVQPVDAVTASQWAARINRLGK